MALRLYLAALVIAATSATLALAQTTQPAQIVMKLHTLTDKGSGNMESHTVLAPAGWTVEGGGWWPAPQLFNILPSQDVTITAPDGRLIRVGPNLGAVDFRPSQMAINQLGSKRPAEGGVDAGYLILYLPDSMDEWRVFLENKAFKNSFPQATNMQMGEVSVVPELTELLRRQIAPIQRQQEEANRMMAGNIHGSCDSGAVLSGTCTYELDGKKWEHLIIFGVVYLASDTQVGRQVWWSIEPSVSYRAEAGQLQANMPLMMSIANSVHPTQKWAQMKMDHIRKMNQIAAKGAADRSAIIANSNREINKMIIEGGQQRDASNERSANNFIKAIREVEDYTGPNDTTPVQLPHYYQHVYSNGQGDYILTNDSLYNPNTDPAVNNKNWDAMKPAGK